MKICPIMTKGWLSNEYSTRGYHGSLQTAGCEVDKIFDIANLPKCIEEDCGCWVKTQGLIVGYCGLIRTRHNA